MSQAGFERNAGPPPHTAQPAHPRPPITLKFDPAEPQPLQYAGPAVPGRAVERARGVLYQFGGVRRIVFALGLAMVLGGFTYAMWPRSWDGALWVALGGLLLGMSVPLRGLDDPQWG